MNNNTCDTRRNFLKKIGLAGIVMANSPVLMASASKKKSAQGDGMVFLFQGDSITDGNRGRNTDPNHIMGHGYAFSIASRLGAGFPEKRFQFYNRGISGNKVSDLALRWQKDTLDLQPDVLSILIGVNDVNAIIRNQGGTPMQFEETYKSLLDQCLTKFPDILFVLCQPFILPVGKVKDNWEMWHAEIIKRQTIVERLANSYNAVYVPFQEVMDKACLKAPEDYWMWDGFHPTVAGHELLTREWIRKVSKRLPFIK